MPTVSSKWRMGVLKPFVYDKLPLGLVWLIFALAAGFLYSLQLLGIELFVGLLPPERLRSLHISLMLYGFVPLFLSLLPFALFEKEGVLSQTALNHLERYFWMWNVFLLFMSVSLALGNLRGLPFYDFPYWLNFPLAFSGVFYLLAIVDALRRYERRPLWVNVSLGVVLIAPLLLVLLMNPQYGQVEQTLTGPHGDNTLGMSFALIPLYYLLIKLSSSEPFRPRWAALWIIPFAGYGISLLIRNAWHPLTYNEEWFFQYLTLLYVPLLWRWWKDAGLTMNRHPYLFFSIAAFLAVDVEGNLLFIPEIRTLIHRNDLVVGHAHVAMGIAVAFMALSIVGRYLPSLITKSCAIGWTTLVGLMALALSAAGLSEAGWIGWNVTYLWAARSVFGGILIVMVLKILFDRVWVRPSNLLGWYHWAGFASDFLGGAALLLFGKTLFGWLGFSFGGGYEYVVFAFMMGTGMVHWAGIRAHGEAAAHVSSLIRLLVAASFAALYTAGTLDGVALLVALYDTAFAAVYFLWLRFR